MQKKPVKNTLVSAVRSGPAKLREPMQKKPVKNTLVSAARSGPAKLRGYFQWPKKLPKLWGYFQWPNKTAKNNFSFIS
jgi:hypothetical protein